MAAELRPAAFVDRDGVINVERGHVHRVQDFQLLPGAAAGLARLSAAGYALVVVTNQAGIAKGLYDEGAFELLTQHMLAMLAGLGIPIAGVYHCPHHPQGVVERYAVVCDCRKPAPGMLLRAARELGLDLTRSVLVGDKPSDTAAGRSAGLRHTVLVRSGHHLPDDAAQLADQVCADLSEAASWLCDPSRAEPTSP